MKLQICDLCKQFDGVPVLDHVSMELESGHIYCLTAPSGKGKTTLFRILMGLETADSGRLFMERVPIGAVFQEDRLCETFSAVDNVLMTSPSSMSRAEVRRELMELLPEEVLDRPAATLSGGQKRRVAIAGVVAMRPEVLILDEPTAGLDPKAHHDVLDMVQEVHRRTGNIIILVSHNMADIARVSDKIIVIDSGHLVTTGMPQEVFAQKELLRGVGLDLPPITEFTETLREKGMALPPTILDTKEAALAIAKALQEKRTKG